MILLITRSGKEFPLINAPKKNLHEFTNTNRIVISFDTSKITIEELQKLVTDHEFHEFTIVTKDTEEYYNTYKYLYSIIESFRHGTHTITLDLGDRA